MTPTFINHSFNLSTDYKALYELVNAGNRIPAYVLYRQGTVSLAPIWDIAEVKCINDNIIIGSRGIGYGSHQKNFEEFERDCKDCNLHYIVPIN